MSVNVPLSQRDDVVVFFNGKYVAGNEARVGVMTHALAYGTGCFEGIRGYWNDEQGELFIFRAREHFERLLRSCRIVNIKLPYTVDELVEIAVQLVRRNDYRENVYVRPFAYKADEIIGVKLHDLHDHFAMYCVPLGDYVSTTGLRCGVSSWRRVDDNMIPARAKISGSYINSALAKTEAQMNGFDEAIMLTSEGHVSEGSAENLFMICGGELITPPASENILLGITRDTVIELARRELEMLTRERVIDRTELYCVDEILLTGTGAQLAPVIEVDHRPIGSGAIGPVASKLQRLYGDVVRGRLPQYLSWCQPSYAGAQMTAQVAQVTADVAATASNGHSTSNGNGHAHHSGNGHSHSNGHKSGTTARRPAASGAAQARKR